MKTKRQRAALLCAVLLLLALALFSLYLLISRGVMRNVCVFNNLTGLRCPGCGNTRAVMAYLRGDFKAALRHNLLFPFEALYIAWVVVNTSLSFVRSGRLVYRTKSLWIDISALAVIVAWWVLRNVWHI